MLEKLTDNNVILERLKQSDSKAVYQAVLESFAEISPWLSWLNASYSQESCDEFIQLQIQNWQNNIEYTYAIKNLTGEIMGMIDLYLFDTQNDVACVGYWMNTKFIGRGLCTQALKLIIKNALVPLNLIRIELLVGTNNHASQRVVTKAGGIFEAVLKNRLRLNGLAVDANMYSFTHEKV